MPYKSWMWLQLKVIKVPPPNYLTSWLSMSNYNVAVHRGKPKDVHENGCGKRNCCVQGETEGQKLTCQGGPVAEIINPVVRFLLKQKTIPYD